MNRSPCANLLAGTYVALYMLCGVAVAASVDGSPPVEVQDEPLHHLVFENAFVRVLEVNVPPGEMTLYHRHRRDNVAVFLGDAEITNQLLGGTRKSAAVKAGLTPLARASGEGYVHQVANTAKTPLLIDDIEFLTRTGQARAEADSNLKPAAENDLYRAYAIQLAPGESSSALTLGPGVRVVIGGAQVGVTRRDGTATLVDTSSHAWQWRDAGVFELRNASNTSSALVVELELK
jgi:hypothetical protein